jgi:hypothetical protein
MRIPFLCLSTLTLSVTSWGLVGCIETAVVGVERSTDGGIVRSTDGGIDLLPDGSSVRDSSAEAEPLGGPSSCVSSAECMSGYFCETPLGNCTGVSFCKPLPEDCPPEAAPVCGCGGTTFDSACLASMKSVSVEHTGSCP